MTKEVIAVDQIMDELQKKYYHLITKKPNSSFVDFVVDIATQIKEIVCANLTEIYLLNECTGEFRLSSHNSVQINNLVSAPFYLSEFNDFIMNNQKTLGFPSGEKLFITPQNDLISFIIPFESNNGYDGFLFVAFTKSTFNEELLEVIPNVAVETLHLISKMKQFYVPIEEGKKYELLYGVTSKFHSSMHMEDVLEEIMITLRKIYKDFDYYLLLSQDDIHTSNLPVKEIDYYNEENKASTQAYLTGQLKFADFSGEETSLYAPLKGKQGIYGVLEIITPNEVSFTEEDIEFITLLANTAGNALENARLYQQSKRLIDDLQLLNKSSQKLNSNMRLPDTFSYMSDLVTTSFKADEVGFVLYHNESKMFRVLDESTEFFSTEEGLGFVSFINSCMENHSNKMFIGDFSNKYSSFSLPYQSVMAVPMIHEQKLIGFVIVVHKDEYFFSFETFKLLQALVQHSTLTVVNSLLKEELEHLVRTDYLTKLYSRKYLDEMMHNHIENGTKGSFILIDIDNFKRINDEYGHEIGDQIILQVADIIKDNIRSHDIAARWGGEELAIYLPNTNIYSCLQVAERLVERVSKYTNPKVTISCGISYWDDTLSDQTKDIFLRADRALYLAKTKGKNRVVKQDEILSM